MKKAVKKLMGDGGIRCGGSLLLKRMLPREILLFTCHNTHLYCYNSELCLKLCYLLPPSSSMILSLGKQQTTLKMDYPGMTWGGKIVIQTVHQTRAFRRLVRRDPSGGVRLDVMTKEQREEWAEDEKNQTPSSWLVGWLVGWVGWLVGWLVGCNLLMIDLMYYVLFCSFLRSGKHRLDSGILFLTQLTGKIAY